MRKVWAVLICVCMLFGMCSAALAELQLGDTVTAVTGGTEFVDFGDSYYGFCVDRKLDGAAAGDEFMVGWMENNVINNNTNEDVSNYIKLFFVDNFEEFFLDEYNSRFSRDFEKDANGNYVFADKTVHGIDPVSFTQSFIWKLTDDVAHSNKEIDQIIENEVARIKELAKTKEIPDWGHTETYSIYSDIWSSYTERKVMFDFRAFYTHRTGEERGQQDFFAFKARSVSAEPTPTPTPVFVPTPTPTVAPTPTPTTEPTTEPTPTPTTEPTTEPTPTPTTEPTTEPTPTPTTEPSPTPIPPEILQNKPPKTGDDTAVALWFGLLILSALAMAALKFRTGKHTN